MSDLMNSMVVSASGMQAQAKRLRYVSENIANADTPGYRRKTTSFETVVENGTSTGRVKPGDVRLDPSDLEEIHDPANPLADSEGNYQGSNVELVVEIADAREARRSYEANLKMLDQTRQMTSSLFELLRR